jgi:Rps23 Pro-64 3,4-dihydroxylase Tpa1-like proline 4-hydroxylase
MLIEPGLERLAPGLFVDAGGMAIAGTIGSSGEIRCTIRTGQGAAVKWNHVERDFLSSSAADDLLAYAIANEQRFTPSGLHYSGEYSVNPAVRTSLRLDDFEPKATEFQAIFMPLVPQLAANLGLRAPTVHRVELELVAHGDGAFFARHLDNSLHAETQSRRFLSGTYYFHATPKAFDGGQLRLFASGAAAPIEVDPVHNSLAVFPPWIVHEVTPVQCGSRRFADSRFSINVWLSTADPLSKLLIASPR